MCGICGFVGVREDGLLERMTDALAHRGPDGTGYFQHGDVGLGHRRLSIIDLEGGWQPLYNEDRSIAVICNGEIYNYRELRAELIASGHQFRTNSDCEVIAHLYEEDGVDCLRRMIGMFALALYDTRTRRLFIARDRLGIKPLYYVDLPGRFLFASEFKSILRYHGFETTLNPRALHDYLALRYVPGPGGMFNEMRKLPAGHFGVLEDGRLTLTRYWEPTPYAGPYPGDEGEYLEEFAQRFERSMQRRLIADVPIGAYLSGGLDSSVTVAAMAKLTSTPVRTFTVGFGYEHDELEAAAKTAQLLGCQHTEIHCQPSDVELIPKIVYHLDEPLGDPIVIPMYQLAQAARKEVAVILAGEGADETMAGYVFHRALMSGHLLARLTPQWVRHHVLRRGVALTPASVLNLAFDYPAALGQRGKLKVMDFLDLLEPDQVALAYRHLTSLFDDRDTTTLYAEAFAGAVRSHPAAPAPQAPPGTPFLNRIIDIGLRDWLPECILTKQDKLSMAHAIEARVPFLDHELVEFALRVPPALKLRGKQNKYLVRQYARRILPDDVVNRRKMPFYFPIEQQFATPAFQELMEDTLSERSVRNRGLFRPHAIESLRNRMRTGDFMYVKQVFSLMVLELWFRMAVDRRAVA
ncbi:MAG: asparagine synthase (glutamine-hydrolyzing) [Vicinamibacterales bacterium]